MFQQTSIHEYHSYISWTNQPFLCQIGALCITCGIQCLLHQTTSLGTLGQVPDAPSDVLDFWHGYTWDARDAHLGDHGEFRWVGGALAWKASTTRKRLQLGWRRGRLKVLSCVMRLVSGRLKMWFRLWNWMDFTFQSSNSILNNICPFFVTASYLTCTSCWEASRTIGVIEFSFQMFKFPKMEVLWFFLTTNFYCLVIVHLIPSSAFRCFWTGYTWHWWRTRRHIYHHGHRHQHGMLEDRHGHGSQRHTIVGGHLGHRHGTNHRGKSVNLQSWQRLGGSGPLNRPVSRKIWQHSMATESTMTKLYKKKHPEKWMKRGG